jgi:hypothetical protein
MPPTFFALVTFLMGSCVLFLQGGGQPDCDLPIYTSVVAGMTGVCHQAKLVLIEMGSLELFAQAGLKPQSS